MSTGKPMTSRARFRETMSYGACDRVPYFEEGVRSEVLEKWYRQGLSPNADLNTLFPSDKRIEIETDLDPHPPFRRWPRCRTDLPALRKRLNPNRRSRMPRKWKKIAQHARDSETVMMLRVHRGLFLSTGSRNWNRLSSLMQLLIDDPDFVRRYMEIYGEFAADLARRILREIHIDAAIFSEPIGGNDRPLISPKMYEDIVLKSYEPVLAVLKKAGVQTIIFRTYANARILIPSVLKWGFNCLWACEVNTAVMGYRSIRREFGRDLRLIGGIDLDALRHGPGAIQRELTRKVPPLLADGGYVPLADGRVREDVTYENYSYYRRLLKEITRG
jgi:uroporphyrinogen decarboxylase